MRDTATYRLLIPDLPRSIPFAVDEKKLKTMDTINDAKQRVKGDINLLKDKLKLARETISKFKTELNKVQGSA